MTLGQRIRSLRQKRGITQSALARAVGAGDSRISVWENDEDAPSLASAIKLADALDCTLDELVGRNR